MVNVGVFSCPLMSTVYRACKNHGKANALPRLPRKAAKEPDEWSIEDDHGPVNRVPERASITASIIREATRGDSVLPRAMYNILHGWPAESSIPVELKIYITLNKTSIPLEMATSFGVLERLFQPNIRRLFYCT